jgi:hypothetical protein
VPVIETGLGIMAAFDRSEVVLAEEVTCTNSIVTIRNAVVAKFDFLLIIRSNFGGLKICNKFKFSHFQNNAFKRMLFK